VFQRVLRRSADAAAAGAVELLEQGLGLHRTKLGSNEKEMAYSMKQTRVRYFAAGVCLALFVLATLTGVFITLYDSERVARIFAHKQSMEKIMDEKHDAIRLAFAMHHQAAEQDEAHRDSMRMLKRITSKIEHAFEEHFDALTLAPDVRAQIKAVKMELVAYVEHELKDFKQEVHVKETEEQKRLQKLSIMQEASMRELLKTMSGMKLNELDNMLSTVFKAAASAPEIHMAESDVDEMENLADSVFGEIVSLDEGRRKFAELRGAIKGTIPKDIEARLANPVDPDDWAECLNQLTEYARLSNGRKQIMAIKAEFDKRFAFCAKQSARAQH